MLEVVKKLLETETSSLLTALQVTLLIFCKLAVNDELWFAGLALLSLSNVSICVLDAKDKLLNVSISSNSPAAAPGIWICPLSINIPVSLSYLICDIKCVSIAPLFSLSL